MAKKKAEYKVKDKLELADIVEKAAMSLDNLIVDLNEYVEKNPTDVMVTVIALQVDDAQHKLFQASSWLEGRAIQECRNPK